MEYDEDYVEKQVRIHLGTRPGFLNPKFPRLDFVCNSLKNMFRLGIDSPQELSLPPSVWREIFEFERDSNTTFSPLYLPITNDSWPLSKHNNQYFLRELPIKS